MTVLDKAHQFEKKSPLRKIDIFIYIFLIFIMWITHFAIFWRYEVSISQLEWRKQWTIDIKRPQTTPRRKRRTWGIFSITYEWVWAFYRSWIRLWRIKLWYSVGPILIYILIYLFIYYTYIQITIDVYAFNIINTQKN